MPFANEAKAPSPDPARKLDHMGLIIADLLEFDPSRLGWRLALRTMAGLALPFLLARLLNAPELIWVGIGAFLLAIGDSLDDGDRWQAARLAVGAVIGGCALASGVVAGSNLASSMAGMAFWGLVAGFMGVYGGYSTGLIPFEDVLYPALHADVGLWRLVATGLGAVLALVGGHLLWPDFERDALPALLLMSLQSITDYAELVLQSAEGRATASAMATGRRQAGSTLVIYSRRFSAPSVKSAVMPPGCRP